MEQQIQKRIRDTELQGAVVSEKMAASWIKDGMTLGLSGFTRAGDVKAVPSALVKRTEKESIKVNVFTGASLGSDVDRLMAEAGIVHKRLPFQANKTMRSEINGGEMLFVDQHLSHTAEALRQGTLASVDFAIVEAVAITEEGMIIPSTSVGNSSIFAEKAEGVIVELNLEQSEAFEGMHDIYEPARQGDRDPIPLTDVEDRIGKAGIQVDREKIKGIVITHQPDSPSTIQSPDEDTVEMAEHLVAFLRKEKELGRLPENLAPLQSGIGSIANAVFHGLLESEFTDLEVYSEVLQDAVFDLMDAGKVRFASGCSITLSESKFGEVYSNIERYKDRLVLRPQEISNHPEVIRRLGLIAINTPLEFDIYGNVNSTHVLGTKMMNGIGGSGDFTRNAGISIFVTKSIAKDGNISSIVPYVSHVDHTEHDVDVIVTEQGYADLRGLAPKERVPLLIENCAHPSYRKQLYDYFEEACENGGHTPHNLEKAFSWHTRFSEHGTMLESAPQPS
ncbi:acetyl-CoA hydrolase/transferase family protein [Salibacterium aidingense]|uniref:acetyl-CoA hydrolase/transferase family protein n=1 Tax=Salibacterium aidingense TaxID=384933 RepID=UPI00041AC9CF|nr:acetyl-CoA hydrolase/transferase family protein [Salibacterium aidingense]